MTALKARQTPSFITRAFRDALGCFATGVTIITTVAPDGRLLGVTINSFNSLSLEPPLVLFSLARSLMSFNGFEGARHFAVNVLGRHQKILANHFATRTINKFANLEFVTGETGCPLIPGAVVYFECETRARYDGGDHMIFVGEVLRLEADMEAEPLVYHRGRFHSLLGD